MKTTITDGQLSALLKILSQAGMTPERCQELLASGMLSAVFDEKTKITAKGLWMLQIALGHHRAERMGEGTIYGLGYHKSWREAALDSKIHVETGHRDTILDLQMPMHPEWRYRTLLTPLQYKAPIPLAQAGRLIQAEGSLWNETTPIQLLAFALKHPHLCEDTTLVATAIVVPCSSINAYVCLRSRQGKRQFGLVDQNAPVECVRVLARSYLSPV